MSKIGKSFAQRCAGLVVILGSFGPAASHAFFVDGSTAINTTFTVDYALSAGSVDGNGNTNVTGQDLIAKIVFELLGFNASNDTIELGVSASNNSVDNGIEVGLQKLAFGTDPDATGVTFTQIQSGDIDKFISGDLNVSPEVQNAVSLDLDVESRTGTGAPRSLREGQTDIFKLLINFDSVDDGVTFSPFSSKWQTAKGSYEFGGTEPGSGPGPGPLPVPAPLALIGLGGLMLGWMTRKSRA